MTSKLKQIKHAILHYPFADDIIAAMQEIEDGAFYGSGTFKNGGRYTQSFSSYNYKHTGSFGTLNKSIITESFENYIALTRTKNNEKDILPGNSMLFGQAHLPIGWELPKDYVFCAQLNISEFKHLDHDAILPEMGILYFLYDEDTSGKVLFYDGPQSELLVPQQMGDSTSAYALSFNPSCIFNIDDEYGAFIGDEILDLLPKDLVNTIETIMECSVTRNKHEMKIFGRPKYWQNEDVDLREENPSSSDERQLIRNAVNHILLFQLPEGEGHIHFWISPEDLNAKAFDRAYMTYSGT